MTGRFNDLAIDPREAKPSVGSNRELNGRHPSEAWLPTAAKYNIRLT